MDYIILGLRRRGFGDRDWFWLGGNDLAKEGVWEWTDCTPWEVSFWGPEEPSNWNGIEHCVAFRVNNRWNAVRLSRQPIAVSDISIYICLIDIRDGSGKPVYGGVDRLQALSSAKTGRRSCFFMN